MAYVIAPLPNYKLGRFRFKYELRLIGKTIYFYD